MKKILLVTGTVLLFAVTALAEPLLTMEDGKPKPSVVTAWKGNGKKVELSLKTGSDANEVADAIKSQVDGVKNTKVKAGKVLVIGLEEAPLLKALADVELGGGDLGALAAASLSDDDEGSGSSLRAKTTQKVNAMFKDRKTVARGTVVSVGGAKYPHAVVKVRILAGPTGPLGKKVRKGKTITFRPKIAMKGGAPDLSDEKTQINVGAWYLRSKDRVQVKIGSETKDGFEAEVISR